MSKLDWRANNFWQLEHGWRVHLPLDEHFGHCWNTRTGEQTDWNSLREILYGSTIEGWTRLVTEAMEHGRNPVNEKEKARIKSLVDDVRKFMEADIIATKTRIAELQALG